MTASDQPEQRPRDKISAPKTQKPQYSKLTRSWYSAKRGGQSTPLKQIQTPLHVLDNLRKSPMASALMRGMEQQLRQFKAKPFYFDSTQSNSVIEIDVNTGDAMIVESQSVSMDRYVAIANNDMGRDFMVEFALFEDEDYDPVAAAKFIYSVVQNIPLLKQPEFVTPEHIVVYLTRMHRVIEWIRTDSATMRVCKWEANMQRNIKKGIKQFGFQLDDMFQQLTMLYIVFTSMPGIPSYSDMSLFAFMNFTESGGFQGFDSDEFEQFFSMDGYGKLIFDACLSCVCSGANVFSMHMPLTTDIDGNTAIASPLPRATQHKNLQSRNAPQKLYVRSTPTQQFRFQFDTVAVTSVA